VLATGDEGGETVFNNFCNSPELYISHIMSDPPINSPAIYNCGIVGQLEYLLIPSLKASSSNTLMVVYSVFRAFRIRHTLSE
jgi:hypothetical protein